MTEKVSGNGERLIGIDEIPSSWGMEELGLVGAKYAGAGQIVYEQVVRELEDLVGRQEGNGNNPLLLGYVENLGEIARVLSQIPTVAQEDSFLDLVIVENEVARQFHEGGDYYTEDLIAMDLERYAKLPAQALRKSAQTVVASLIRAVEQRQPTEAEGPQYTADELYGGLLVPNQPLWLDADHRIEVVRDDAIRVRGRLITLNRHQVFILNVFTTSQNTSLSSGDFISKGFGQGISQKTILTRFSREKTSLLTLLAEVCPGLVQEDNNTRPHLFRMNTVNVEDVRGVGIEVQETVRTNRRHVRTRRGPNHQEEDYTTLSSSDLRTANADLQQYYKDISRYEVLSHERVVELVQAMKEGEAAIISLGQADLDDQQRSVLESLAAEGAKSKEKLILHNLRLVVWVAKPFDKKLKMVGANMKLLDIIQEGNFGLTRAIEKFDPEKGTKLSTYAVIWIKQYIKRAIADKERAIRAPVNLIDLSGRIDATRRRLIDEIGREPTDEDIVRASFGTVSISDLEKYRMVRGTETRSLDAKVGREDDERALIDQIEDRTYRGKPESHMDAVEFESRLDSAISSLDLNVRERWVVSMRFGVNLEHLRGTSITSGNETYTYEELIGVAIGSGGMTLEQIGEVFGVTRERIRQIESRTMRRLRDSSKMRALVE